MSGRGHGYVLALVALGLAGQSLEDDDGFGPFPADMTAECIARDGGEVACRLARWNANFMRWIYSLTR